MSLNGDDDDSNYENNNSSSTAVEEPNVRCSKCNFKFYLNIKKDLIGCPNCGYRIIDKLRTKNHIHYLAE